NDLIVSKDGSKAKFVVTGFDTDTAILALLDDRAKFSGNLRVVSTGEKLCFGLKNSSTFHGPLGFEDADTKLEIFDFKSSYKEKRPVMDSFRTGVKAIDWFMPIGRGQRLAVIANAGTGKSTLLRYLLIHAGYDIAVIGLIGERGREVVEFEDFLNRHSLAKRVKVIVSTSNESPVLRLFSFYSVTKLADYYRSCGKNVLLIVDSLTRVARAIREIGFQNGELPVRQGLTPSVFTILPKLLEVPGNSDTGSITAFYTLLTADHHENDVLSEEIKSLLDGHFILSRSLLQKGVYPAIDIVHSLSRLSERFHEKRTRDLANFVRLNLKLLEQDRDLMFLSSTLPDHLRTALQIEELVHRFTTQAIEETWTSTEFEKFMLNITQIQEQSRKKATDKTNSTKFPLPARE
ncbi:MAG: hypothetical protein N2654_05380, partial [Deltaproteobacteria bacterium]|nr:hypothetical protein [Deltaproteobacteria bacterium]